MHKYSNFQNEVFGEIRTYQVNNQIMFVGKDVAKALGYANTVKAIRDHVDSEDKGVNEMVTPSGIQRVIFINESGLYALILSSKLPQARTASRCSRVKNDNGEGCSRECPSPPLR